MNSRAILFASLVSAICCAAVIPAFASPRAAAASGSAFMVSADDLSGWHLGGYYRYASREVNDGFNNLSQDNFALTVGHDIFSFLSVYALGGVSNAQLENQYQDSDKVFLYGFGGWLNIIDHDLLSNLSLETKIRLQAFGQISYCNPEFDSGDSNLRDYYANLTLSIVNNLIGNKHFWPEAIAIFFGPVYDKTKGDDLDFTGEEVGFLFGLDIALDRNVGLSLSYEAYGSDDNALGVSLNYHF